MQVNPARYLTQFLRLLGLTPKVPVFWASYHLLGSIFFGTWFGFGLGAVTCLQASAQSINPQSSQSFKSEALVPYAVLDDGVQAPLGERLGVVSRGAQIVTSREGQCTLCHAIPGYKGQVGNLAPLLEGVGARLTKPQLRLRIINSSLIYPQTIMPSYYKIDGLVNVDPQWRGVPLLNEQQIEDVVAYLSSLK